MDLKTAQQWLAEGPGHATGPAVAAWFEVAQAFAARVAELESVATAMLDHSARMVGADGVVVATAELRRIVDGQD